MTDPTDDLLAAAGWLRRLVAAANADAMPAEPVELGYMLGAADALEAAAGRRPSRSRNPARGSGS